MIRLVSSVEIAVHVFRAKRSLTTAQPTELKLPEQSTNSKGYKGYILHASVTEISPVHHPITVGMRCLHLFYDPYLSDHQHARLCCNNELIVCIRYKKVHW